MDNVKEFIKTLKPITDFSTLKKGDAIFNKCSLNTEYIDAFDHLEIWDDGIEMVYYTNYQGEYWWGKAQGYWYYI